MFFMLEVGHPGPAQSPDIQLFDIQSVFVKFDASQKCTKKMFHINDFLDTASKFIFCICILIISFYGVCLFMLIWLI